ncbi:MAG: hypothetical protein PHT54_04675 [Candidatus Nanoarchaeia archaeon]|nr:hypothetical protein [Candidatus Nanoarchaeia archaeon]
METLLFVLFWVILVFGGAYLNKFILNKKANYITKISRRYTPWVKKSFPQVEAWHGGWKSWILKKNALYNLYHLILQDLKKEAGDKNIQFPLADETIIVHAIFQFFSPALNREDQSRLAALLDEIQFEEKASQKRFEDSF